jgi:hypothetical protein
LGSPPKAGGGVHAWLFRVSRQLHAHLPAPDIARLLEDRLRGCGRPVPRREIVAAVGNSLVCAWQPKCGGPAARVSQWPAVDTARRSQIVASGRGCVDLWEASPVRIEDNAAHTEKIIDRLFPGNPLLCCGASQSEFTTKPREHWRGKLAALSFIVPSPMTAPIGLTQAGRLSAHTLANTGPRRFLVCEFDSGTVDEQAALLLHLAERGPMVMALHSGGKSLHGWFCVAGQPEDRVRHFFRYAVSLGADRATWTRSQFVRMPDGARDNGQRQTVFFLNLSAIKP